MNEEVKIYSIDEVLDRIGSYIDCSEFMDEEEDYQFSNIVYYLEKYQEQQQEIDRLNNIINQMEEYLKEGTELTIGCGITTEYIYAYENALEKLKELKEE